MDNDNCGDLKISGSGRAGGGLFHKVSISGSGEITGDTECDSFSVSGSGRVQGALKTGRATISGSARIGGRVECADTFKISGSAKLDGNVKCGELRVSGEAHLGGTLDAEEVSISGSSKIAGDCNAERFSASGGFHIDGLLNAGTIELRLFPFGTRAREIGGERITVSRLHADFLGHILRIFTPGRGYLLETGTIEGDEISLVGTKAAVVRGVNVRIGDGCEIGLVEYSGTLEKTGDSVVKEERKL